MHTSNAWGIYISLESVENTPNAQCCDIMTLAMKHMQWQCCIACQHGKCGNGDVENELASVFQSTVDCFEFRYSNYPGGGSCANNANALVRRNCAYVMSAQSHVVTLVRMLIFATL